jgi:hypothetical protein
MNDRFAIGGDLPNLCRSIRWVMEDTRFASTVSCAPRSFRHDAQVLVFEDDRPADLLKQVSRIFASG